MDGATPHFANKTITSEGASYEPDRNQDEVLSIDELYEFLKLRVPQLIQMQKTNATTEQNPHLLEISKPAGFNSKASIYVFD